MIQRLQALAQKSTIANYFVKDQAKNKCFTFNNVHVYGYKNKIKGQELLQQFKVSPVLKIDETFHSSLDKGFQQKELTFLAYNFAFLSNSVCSRKLRKFLEKIAKILRKKKSENFGAKNVKFLLKHYRREFIHYDIMKLLMRALIQRTFLRNFA